MECERAKQKYFKLRQELSLVILAGGGKASDSAVKKIDRDLRILESNFPGLVEEWHKATDEEIDKVIAG